MAGLVIAFLAFVLILGAPSRGLGQGLAEALSGTSHPLSLRLREFGDEWRRVMVPSMAAANGNVAVNINGNSNASTSQNNINGALGGARAYVTKGETVSAGGRIYLVAYHLPGTGLNLGMLLQAVATKSLPEVAALTSDTAIPLSLLDLASLGALDDVRAFDMAAEIAESEKAARMISELVKAQSSESAKPPQNK